MGILKNILALLGLVVVIVVIGGYAKFGGMISKIKELDSGAIPAYVKMFNTVLETGDTAKAMIVKYKISDDVANDDAVEAIKALAEEYNMVATGDVKMFTKEDAAPTEVKHARIISVCSLPTAKQFLNFSPEFGGFMPCRIMLIEYGNGDRFLYTMDLNLAVHGGKTLPPAMLELATKVQDAMYNIPRKAAAGEF